MVSAPFLTGVWLAFFVGLLVGDAAADVGGEAWDGQHHRAWRASTK